MLSDLYASVCMRGRERERERKMVTTLGFLQFVVFVFGVGRGETFRTYPRIQKAINKQTNKQTSKRF